MRVDDLTIEQGTTWSMAWPITVESAPVDLTGWTVRAQIRPDVSSSTVLFEWSTTLHNATVTGSKVTLSLTPQDSAGWTWTDAVYDVHLTDLVGRVARVTGGAVVVSHEVTR